MPYKRTTTWGEIGNKFFLREKENASKSVIKKIKIKENVINEMNTIEKKIIDSNTGKIILIKEIIDKNENFTTQESEKEFFERMKKNIIDKENRLRILDATVHGNNCTFQPYIEKKKKSGKISYFLSAIGRVP